MAEANPFPNGLLDSLPADVRANILADDLEPLDSDQLPIFQAKKLLQGGTPTISHHVSVYSNNQIEADEQAWDPTQSHLVVILIKTTEKPRTLITRVLKDHKAVDDIKVIGVQALGPLDHQDHTPAFST